LGINEENIVEVCNQENQILVTNETRHPIIFYPFEKGVSCFFERRGCVFKSLGPYVFKELKPILQNQ
jgi:hypothetical protein